jgi:hypothetical protein
VIDHQTFSLQHDVQSGTAKTLPLSGKLTHPSAQGTIVTAL